MAETELLEKLRGNGYSAVKSSLSLRHKSFYMPRKANLHFEISERKIFLRIFDVVWVLFSLYVVSILFRLDYFEIDSASWHWGIVLALYISVSNGIFELYDLQKAGNYYRVLQNVVLSSSVVVLFFLMTPVVTPVLPNDRVEILYFFLTILFTLLLWRFSYIALISSPKFLRRVLIIGEPVEVELVASHVQRSDPNYNIVGYVNPGTGGVLSADSVGLREFSSERLEDTIRKHAIDEVLISNVTSTTAEGLYSEVLNLLKKGFPVKDLNEVYEDKTSRIPVQHIERNFYQFFPLSKSNDNKLYLFFHRLADVLISVIGLAVGSFLLILVYFGNMIANKGCLFYRQERVGKNGRSFTILKFRTMQCDAEPNGAVWATKNDVRITRFGKFLRRSRLDEFPQFWNILKGEMSLIGPRPERPVFVKELSDLIPFYDTRHFVKPGLTGWAQVMTDYANSHADSLEKLQYDLYYIKHRNIFLDITILTKTLSTVIFFRGQ